MSCLADPKELRSFATNDRQMIAVLVRRIDWLTDKIDRVARAGGPVGIFRLERKATRWSLLQMGLALVPNPPIPEPGSVDDPDVESVPRLPVAPVTGAPPEVA